MSDDNSSSLADTYITPTYDRSLMLVKGRGSTVWDAQGKSYIDLLSGVAVCSTGHCHPLLLRQSESRPENSFTVQIIFMFPDRENWHNNLH